MTYSTSILQSHPEETRLQLSPNYIIDFITTMIKNCGLLESNIRIITLSTKIITYKT